VGDVSNVLFCNGMVARKNGDLLIYYASSDTRCHVATTTIAKMLDYVKNTPEDGLRSAASVQATLRPDIQKPSASWAPIKQTSKDRQAPVF
jgi:hypothetical protein